MRGVYKCPTRVHVRACTESVHNTHTHTTGGRLWSFEEPVTDQRRGPPNVHEGHPLLHGPRSRPPAGLPPRPPLRPRPPRTPAPSHPSHRAASSLLSPLLFHMYAMTLNWPGSCRHIPTLACTIRRVPYGLYLGALICMRVFCALCAACGMCVCARGRGRAHVLCFSVCCVFRVPGRGQAV